MPTGQASSWNLLELVFGTPSTFPKAGVLLEWISNTQLWSNSSSHSSPSWTLCTAGSTFGEMSSCSSFYLPGGISFYVICFFFVIFFFFCLFVFLCSPFFLARWSDLFLFFVFCDFSFFVVFLCSYSQFYLPQLGPFYICQVKALLYEGLCPFNKCFLLVDSYCPRRMTHFDSWR